jgi:hypothetical protein
MGDVLPGAGAQGTKDGPLGVGPIPVLSEPLGSSISTTVAQDCPSAETVPYSRCPQTPLRRQIVIHRLADDRHIRFLIRKLTA